MGGGGKGGGGGGEAARMRAEEQARQERIRQGIAQINRIFDGSYVGVDPVAGKSAYNPNTVYYTSTGARWEPTPIITEQIPAREWYRRNAQKNGKLFERMIGESVVTPAYPVPEGVDPDQIMTWTEGTPIEKQFEEALSKGLYYGRQKVGGFNDDYFNNLRQSYINYATPQLEDQYARAQKELAYALARGGLLDSSVRADKSGELQRLYDLNRQQIADQALAYETDARNAIESARSDLISLVNQTSNVEAATKAALARAQALSKPPAFSPLTQLFGDFMAGLGTQAALERANYYSGGMTPVRYSTGLFTPGKDSVKVVG